MSRTYYVYRKVIDHTEIGKEIGAAKKQMGGRSIKCLLVLAHGDKDLIQLGKNSLYRTSSVKKEDFEGLDPKAMIVIDSCSTGASGGLSEKIAELSDRVVHAATQDYDINLFMLQGKRIHCSPSSEFIKPSGVIYKRNGSRVMSREPIPHSLFIKSVWKKAMNGSVEDQMLMGWYYLVKNRFNDAFRFYEMASDAGKPFLFSLASVGKYKNFSPVELKAQFLKTKVSSMLGSKNEVFVMARCYANGIGTQKSLREAIYWFETLDDLDMRSVSYQATELAKCYEEMGGETPFWAALIYQKMVENKDDSPIVQQEIKEYGKKGLIRVYHKMSGKGAQSYEEALKWFQNYPIDQAFGGTLPIYKHDLKLSDAAKLGNRRAQVLLRSGESEKFRFRTIWEELHAAFKVASSQAITVM